MHNKGCLGLLELLRPYWEDVASLPQALIALADQGPHRGLHKDDCGGLCVTTSWKASSIYFGSFMGYFGVIVAYDFRLLRFPGSSLV